MASLYDRGWRQGSVLSIALPLESFTVDGDGSITKKSEDHGRWVVATQDCDLDLTEYSDHDPRVELRPVFAHDPPADLGIRSYRFLLTRDNTEYVHGTSPRVIVSAALLTRIEVRCS